MIKSLQQRLSDIKSNAVLINAEAVRQLLAEQLALVIDVREPQEYAQTHADSAINIPRGVLEMQVIEKVSTSDFPIVLYCASSARAKLGAEQLEKMGYTNLYVITCPIDVIAKTL